MKFISFKTEETVPFKEEADINIREKIIKNK